MADPENKSARPPRLRFRGAARVRPPTQIAALDIDGAVLRVAAGTRRGKGVEFNRVVSAPLSWPEDADTSDAATVGKAVGAALETLRFKPGAVAVGVPRKQVILRTVSLPDLDDVRELASMIQLQVGKDLPFRKEEAVIDFELRRTSTAHGAGTGEGDAPADAPELEALVAVVQRDVVQFYRDVCAAAGLKLSALTLLPFANAQCLATCGVGGTDETVAVVALRSEEVSVDIVRNGKLLFSRDAELVEGHHEEMPPADESSAETVSDAIPAEPAITNGQLTPVERITIEVVRSLHAFGGMMPDHAVTRFVVAGGTGLEGEVADALAKRMELPVAVLDVASALQLEAAERESSAAAFSVMGVVTAATDPAGLPFNFIDPKRPAVQRDMKRVRVLALAAVVVLLFAGVLGVRGYLLKQRILAQQKIQEEIGALAKHQPIFRRTRAQAASVQGWISEQKSWLEHYAYLSAVLPGSEEVYITSLSVSPQGTVRLAVQARSGEILAKLDKRLREAGYDVKPQAITPGTDRHGYDFRSSVELVVPPRMKIDLSKVKPPARPADDVSLNPSGRNAALEKEVPSVTIFGGGQ